MIANPIFFNEQCISAITAHIIPGGHGGFAAASPLTSVIPEKQVKIRTLCDDDDI